MVVNLIKNNFDEQLMSFTSTATITYHIVILTRKKRIEIMKLVLNRTSFKWDGFRTDYVEQAEDLE